MNFLHISDLHIGEGRTLPNYLDRYQKVLWQVFDVLKKHSLNLLLVSGDIFHRVDLTHEEKDLIVKWLSTLEQKKINTFMINGQHDIINPHYTHLNTFDILKQTKIFKHIHIINTIPQLFDMNQFGQDWKLLCIPYDKKLGEQGLRELYHKYNPNAIMAHVTIKNTVLSNGFKLPEGITLPDDLDVYWFLGDIHNRSYVAKKGWYAGSILQHTFGDTAEHYGGMLVLNGEPQPINFQYKPLITIDIDNTDDNWEVPDAWINLKKEKGTSPLVHPNIIKYTPKKENIKEEKVKLNLQNWIDIFEDNLKEEFKDLEKVKKYKNWTLNTLKEKIC